ncbi:MAG TPA: diphosphomevalonate decarboxylase [Gammaproteobacteria bacterium]|nr:diphosphomevalonate decarboxylase [Gammaproteobacteria bacterium]
MQGRAKARANIALVKYWGKADERLKIPAVGSISITLDALWSETEVRFDAGLAGDELVLDGAERPEQRAKVSACLDVLREAAGVSLRARVVSRNNFPTGAGLASSASGFAALAAAAAKALGLELSGTELSIVARRGSGSAARSVFGGFVEMHAGRASDGRDSFAEPLLPREAWPLEVVVAITARGEKEIGSGAGMARSEQSSPYYGDWVATHPADLAAARDAIRRRDFEALADVAEHSCLKMHAAAMAAKPALIYWNGTTVECMNRVRKLRRSGVGVFFTIDAGPQVKAVCEPGATARVAAALAEVPGVLDRIVTGLGPGVEAG